MNGLIGKEKFVSDLHSSTTSLHPLIIIEGSNPVYISQNEEVIPIDGVPVHFKSLNLKVPSIKQSLDLENRRIKTNNITISFSNAENFSDMFVDTLLLNRSCKVYWKSPSCESLSDCLLVYSAYIKRVEHDKDNVKILLEDKTDLMFHREVPSARITPTNSPDSEAEERVIPMAYGKVDKAPCVLWKKEEDDDSNIYAITDDIDLITGNGRGISHGLGGGLSVYDGIYGAITNRFSLTSPDYTLGLDNLFEYDQQVDYGNGYATILCRYSDTGNAWSPASHGILKADFIRKVTSLKLLDGEEAVDLDNQLIYNQGSLSSSTRTYTGMGTHQKFLGASDGYYVSDLDKIFKSKKITYSGLPLEEINDISEVTNSTPHATLPAYGVASSEDLDFYNDSTGEAFIVKDDFYPQTTGIPLYLDRDESGREYKRIISHLLQEDANENSFEFIFLPDLKKIHGLFTQWYQQNGVSGWRVVGWNEYAYQNAHMMGHTYTWQDCYGCMNYEQNVSAYSPSSIDTYEGTDLWFEGGANFPRPLFRFSVVNESTGESLPSGFVTFNINPITGDSVGEFDSLSLNGGNQGAETGFAEVDFWTLIEDVSEYSYKGSNGQDMPRYTIINSNPSQSIVPENFIQGDNIMPSDPIESFFKTFYRVGWNGVDSSIYSNTYERGGLNSGEASYSPWRNTQQSNWFSFFEKESPFILIKQTMEIDGVFLNQGLLLPIVFNSNFTDINTSSINHIYGGYNPSVGGMVQYSPNYMRITSNGGVLNEGNADKIGLLFNFEDLSIADMMPESSSTRILPFIKMKIKGSSIHDDFDLNTSNNTPYNNNYFKAARNILWSFSDSRAQGSANEALTNWAAGIGTDDYFTWFNGTDRESLAQYKWDTQYGDEITEDVRWIPSNQWTTPSQYSSVAMQIGISRTAIASDSGGQINPSLELYLKIYGANIRHRVNLINIESKSYFYNTKGRQFHNPNPVSIIQDIVRRELSANTSDLETPLDLEDWKMAFSVSEATNSKKLIEDICRSAPCLAKINQTGSINFDFIKNTYESSDVQFLIDSSEIISLSFDRTKIEKVKTLCKVLYNVDYATKEYLSSTYYTDVYDFYGNGDIESSYSDGYKKQYYGLNHNDPSDGILEFKSDYIRDPQVAKKLRDFLLAYNCNQHNILKIRLPLKFVGMEIGKIVQLTSLLNNKKCFGEDYTTSTTRNGQEIYPYFITTSVTRSIKHIDIICEQLHNLDKNLNIIEIGSGDILRRGFQVPDVLDINALEQYLDGENQYFTEGQMANADLNSNHFVDEGDLALLEEVVDGVDWEDVAEENDIEPSVPPLTQFTLNDAPINGNWGTIQTTQVDTILMGISRGWDETSYELSWNFLEEEEGMDIFRDNPDIFNSGNVLLSDNDDIVQRRTPISNQNYTGTGQSVPSIFIGWHMKIGNEWVRIIDAYTSYSNLDISLSFAGIGVERGLFGTDIVAHNAGETVLIFQGYPPDEAFEDVVEPDEPTIEDTIDEQDVIATNIFPPNNDYPEQNGDVFWYGFLWRNYYAYSQLPSGFAESYANPIITFNAEGFEQEEIDSFLHQKGAKIEFIGESGQTQIISSGIEINKVPWFTGNEDYYWRVESQDYFINSHFCFVNTGVLKNIMPQGTIVNLQNPHTTTGGSFVGSYRGYDYDDFAVLADNISKFASYKTARTGITGNNNFTGYVQPENPFEGSGSYQNSGIITYGTDLNKLDKNGNSAFYMGVRLEDFYNQYGSFTPEVGDKYIIVESKLYGQGNWAVGGSGHNTYRWFGSVGEWGINPITGIQNTVTSSNLESDYGSYLYDPAEMIEIKEVYLPNDSDPAMRGVVVIYRDMADVSATGGQPTIEGMMVSQRDYPNSLDLPDIPAEPITNYLEGGHICSNMCAHLLVKVRE